MKKLYLVDASNMFFRAFYAIRQLTNSKGMPTNALYGYLTMTLKLLKEKRPDYMAYCFDSKEPSFRSELFTEYKANRTEMPEELVQQMPYFQKLTELLGIPTFQRSGIEADDIIGTLTHTAQKHHLQVVIVSGDKDFAQLINPNVTMYDTMKEVIYDVPGVKEKWGIRPEQMIDYLALIGDSSDNIPGIKGVGPKTALKLLDQYETLDAIYKNVEDVKPEKLKEKIQTSREIAYLSQQLVTIKVDLDFPSNLEDLKMKPVQRDSLVTLLHELDFKTLEKKIFSTLESSDMKDSAGAVSGSEETSHRLEQMPTTTSMPTSQKSASVEKESKSVSPSQHLESDIASSSSASLEETSSSTAAKNKSSKKSATDRASTQGSFALEAETESEVSVSPKELAAHLTEGQAVWCFSENRGFYISNATEIWMLSGDLTLYSQVLNQKNLKWKGFDLKNLFKLLKLEAPISQWDHQIAAYVLNAGDIGSFSEVYAKYSGSQLSDFPSAQELLAANIELEAILAEKLKTENGDKVYSELDLPLISVLYKMEALGIALDSEMLKKQSEELYKDIKALEKSIYEVAGDNFNIASPKQLSQVLFERLKLTPLKKTKTGFSTDSDVLQKLEKQHPIARLIIEYRELSKLKSTYVDALPLIVDPQDQRIHTIFHQTVTTTGRLSSSHPNLQNIPIRTERGNAVRKAFVARPGCELISADYSQIELRVLAHVTSDPGLVKAFENDLDIHTATASEVFAIPLEQVTPDLRRIAKAVNFGLAYGMGAHGLAENLGISRGEAAEIIKKYFIQFPNVKQYMSDTIEIAKSQGYVETIFHRRRYAPELQSKSAMVRNFGERAVINAPMQGTAADIVKKAMIDIDRELGLRMLLQVHDELIFEVEKNSVADCIAKIKEKMETVVTLKVPLKVNISHGPSWYDAH